MAQQLWTRSNKPPGLPDNLLLDHNALLAVTAPHFETQPHFCQRWVRQVVQATFGDQFDEFWEPTAAATGQAFAVDFRLVVDPHQGSQPGDLLYKLTGSGAAGHVAIRILGNRVAENSSCHWNGRDARGLRKLTEFGHADLIVRLALE